VNLPLRSGPDRTGCVSAPAAPGGERGWDAVRERVRVGVRRGRGAWSRAAVV